MNKRKYVGFFFSLLASLACPKASALTQELNLKFDRLGTTKIQIVLPDESLGSRRRLPVIVSVTGFQTAKQIAAAMTGPLGNNILIAYEYPLEDKINGLDWSKRGDLSGSKLVPAIPLQIAAVLNWLRGPDLINQFGVGADLERVNVVAISLGIFFVPMALKLAEVGGLQENSVVLAYAGAKLGGVIEKQISETQGGPDLARLLKHVVQAVAAPFEPTNYIHDVHAKHFLILNALDDQIFSRESQQALIDAAPQPKEVISVPGVHIGLNQPERVASTIEIFKGWFLKNQAVNP